MLRVKRTRGPDPQTTNKRHPQKLDEMTMLKIKLARYEKALLEALELSWEGRLPLQPLERALRRAA